MRLEERLAQDWRRAFSEQLVDSVQDIYDFFQSDARLFGSSALFRLLKHLELRMSSQLRTLFTVRMSVVLCSVRCGEDRPCHGITLDAVQIGSRNLKCLHAKWIPGFHYFFFPGASTLPQPPIVSKLVLAGLPSLLCVSMFRPIPLARAKTLHQML